MLELCLNRQARSSELANRIPIRHCTESLVGSSGDVFAEEMDRAIGEQELGSARMPAVEALGDRIADSPVEWSTATHFSKHGEPLPVLIG